MCPEETEEPDRMEETEETGFLEFPVNVRCYDVYVTVLAFVLILVTPCFVGTFHPL